MKNRHEKSFFSAHPALQRIAARAKGKRAGANAPGRLRSFTEDLRWAER